MKTKTGKNNTIEVLRGGERYIYLQVRVSGLSVDYDICDGEGNKLGEVNTLEKVRPTTYKYEKKTIIKIDDVDGNVYLLEEDISGTKELIKKMLPKPYGSAKLVAARTGDMNIKCGENIIGRIEAHRTSFDTTYIIDKTSSIESKMDARLIVGALVFKGMRVQ